MSGLRDPFYFGIYGGSRPSGFLASDANADQFFRTLGYEPADSVAVFQRDISEPRDPVNFRLTTIRRKWEIILVDRTHDTSWWWETRFGRLDSIGALLVPKGNAAAPPVAGVTITGLDCYRERWRHHALGLSQLFVVDEERGKGFGQATLVETIRRLRKELVTLVELHVPSENAPALATVKSSGFTQVDTGTVYRRTE
jgi:ribosomal protein S18 acetylase RimI-like enzyme